MKLIFCNVAYLNYYDGRITGERIPKTGGSWVENNEDGHEKWNFLNMDGMCYGYMKGRDELHIEKLDPACRHEDRLEDVTVVWCARHPTRGTVIVGWYEHATALRYMEECVTTPITGIQRWYWFSTKAENACLLPEEDRVFSIGRAAKTGAGTGFGRMNYWLAASDYARETIIPQVLDWIEAHRGRGINVQNAAFEPPQKLPPLTRQEQALAETLLDEDLMAFLPYAYRMYANSPTADNAGRIGDVLRELFQYRRAAAWYEKTLELDGQDLDTAELLPYVYEQCGEYEKEIAMAQRLLDWPDVGGQDVMDELYSILADANHYLGREAEAVSWLDRVLAESKNRELLEHTAKVRASWLNQEE